MSEQVSTGKFCAECKRERYYAKGLCSACYMQARRIKQGLPQKRRPIISPVTDEERRAQRREIERRYRERHPEKIAAKEQKRRSTEEYKRNARERTARWKTTNPIKAATSRSEFYQRNKERLLAKNREWVQANPDKRRASELRSEARRRGARVGDTISRPEAYERFNGLCHICGGAVSRDKFEIEHVIPIIKGGEHSWSNIAIAHPKCNRSKGGKLHTSQGQIRLL